MALRQKMMPLIHQAKHLKAPNSTSSDQKVPLVRILPFILGTPSSVHKFTISKRISKQPKRHASVRPCLESTPSTPSGTSSPAHPHLDLLQSREASAAKTRPSGVVLLQRTLGSFSVEATGACQTSEHLSPATETRVQHARLDTDSSIAPSPYFLPLHHTSNAP